MRVPANRVQLDDIMDPDGNPQRVLAIYYSTAERKRVEIVYQDAHTPPEFVKEVAWYPKYMIEVEREVPE